MRILGVDPGLSNTGLAILDFVIGDRPKVIHTHLFQTSKLSKKDRQKQNIRVSVDDDKRMKELYVFIKSVIVQYKPDMIGIENYSPRVGFGHGFKTIIAVTTIKSIALEMDIVYYSFLPIDIKMSICNKGSASKENVKEDLLRLIDLDLSSYKEVEYEHIVDSCAIAYITHKEIQKIKQLIGEK